MPPRKQKLKKSPELVAFMATEEGVKLFTALTTCAEGIRGISEFIHATLPSLLRRPDASDGESDGKRRKDPTRPKRPASGYLLFTKEIRSGLVEEHKDWSNQEIMAEAGARWKALSKEDKKPYEDAAELEGREYSKKIDAYREEHGLPPRTSASAKQHHALDLAEEKAARLEAGGDEDEEGEEEDSEGSESEQVSDDDEEEEAVEDKKKKKKEVVRSKATVPVVSKPAKKATTAPVVATKKATAGTTGKPAKENKVPAATAKPQEKTNAKGKQGKANSAPPAVAAVVPPEGGSKKRKNKAEDSAAAVAVAAAAGQPSEKAAKKSKGTNGVPSPKPAKSVAK
ncbi:hypothetical protein HKX48_002304 [Thoreauomyces humboldtii]|nr:hypothetical protein HKX48_002304 [Thoreauomyces humboldtii]